MQTSSGKVNGQSVTLFLFDSMNAYRTFNLPDGDEFPVNICDDGDFKSFEEWKIFNPETAKLSVGMETANVRMIVTIQ